MSGKKYTREEYLNELKQAQKSAHEEEKGGDLFSRAAETA